MNHSAIRFLNRCFTPDETIALLLRRENPPWITQRVVRLERALEPRYQAWLSYENGTGANIYVAANPLIPGTRKRTKESIASVRHLYIDIDTDGDARLAALRASDLVPPPTSILSTSPGKYQVLWKVEGFDFDRQEQMLKLLAMAFGGDPACTDRNRVLRIPGFLNQKYDPAFRVTVEYPNDSIWTPDDFRLDADAVEALPCAPEIQLRKPRSKHSNSENDWAMGLRSTCPRQRCHETDTGTGFTALRQAQSALLRAAYRRCCLGPLMAARRHPHWRRHHHA